MLNQSDASRSPAVFLLGPTASGKTGVALQLAENYPFEIVSVDSAQVYRGMDIGTAKSDLATRQRLPHHLIDIRSPTAPYSVAEFRSDALRLMAEIADRGSIPLLVGGTMLYFKALVEGLASLPAADAGVRRQISQLAALEGWGAVHRRLGEVDPAAAAQIHVNDPQRIQRALEIYELSGKSMTDFVREQGRSPDFPYRLCQIALVPGNRQGLYRRIEERFHQMLSQGLVEEVKRLAGELNLHGHLPAMKAVGYRQVWDYLQGSISYETMVAKALIASRNLAKRQLTWIRSWSDLIRIDTDEEEPLREVLKILGTHDIVAP